MPYIHTFSRAHEVEYFACMEAHVSTASFESLHWLRRFLDETPGDDVVGGRPRQVPKVCWSRVEPAPAPHPTLRLWSTEMGKDLGLEPGHEAILSGSHSVKGMDSYAQRYGGHQFGHWAGQLGDGRAITLGEVKTDSGVLELQLKGAGATPYSRTADGKAVLRSSIREFLCSEAMHHLGVPTTRALSLATTGEAVVRDVLYNGNPAPEPGAVVCRVAPSFLRFGSFQIHAAMGDRETLATLVEHAVKHHFPGHHATDDDGLIAWLERIAEDTAVMIAHWNRVGFVHGVMNTDNMSIHGLTIDYGPYGWLEDYNPNWTPNTTDASRRRYRYGQQAHIGAWNVARLLESIGPLMEDPERLHNVLDAYYAAYEKHNIGMWAGKLGLDELDDSDAPLLEDLIALLQKVETDMTIFFRLLSSIQEPKVEHLQHAFYDVSQCPEDEWNEWLMRWWQRVDGRPKRDKMRLVNPKYVLRNWMAQVAIEAAENEDYSVAETLYELLKKPYDEQPESEDEWFKKRPEWATNKVGCSMLSCSS